MKSKNKELNLKWGQVSEIKLKNQESKCWRNTFPFKFTVYTE